MSIVPEFYSSSVNLDIPLLVRSAVMKRQYIICCSDAIIQYNSFPWPNPTDEQRLTIEKTAKAIIEARNNHPNNCLADLYDERSMPQDLRKAHQANDRAVMQAYGMPVKETDEAV